MSVTIPFEAALPAASGPRRANGTTYGNGTAYGASAAAYAVNGTAAYSVIPGDAACDVPSPAYADTWTAMLPRASGKRSDTWTKALQLPGTARAASAARDHVRRAVRAWNAVNAATRVVNQRTNGHLLAQPHITEDAIETAILLTSELVTNALTHGESPVTVAVSWSGGQLRIEVHDRSGQLPAPWPVHMAPDDETGRGLLLVDTLATDWGFYRTPGGKAVYFTLDCPAGC
jgi:anti-sigma regulatory factor (Ser/Thr protein kinase)